MTEPDDLTRRLDALGRTSPPPPSPVFLDDLDAGRLRRPVHRARPFRLPVLLPVAAAWGIKVVFFAGAGGALVGGSLLFVAGRIARDRRRAGTHQ